MIENLAIIGLGSIGRKHLRLVKEIRPEINIIIVRSGVNKNFKEKKIANKIVFSIEDALKIGIQAAIVSTPSVYHAEQTIKLLKSGVNVLVEKPLSNSLKNIEKFLDYNQKSDTQSLLGYCLRYDPGALKFKKMLKERNIGKILHVQIDCGSFLPNWRKEKDYSKSVSAKSKLGGGVLLELSHELDYIRWFFGDMINVYANMKNSKTLDIEVEDSADIIFDSKQGFTISLHLDFNSHSSRRLCSVRCTEGDLIWDAIEKNVIWNPAQGSIEVEKMNHNNDDMYRMQLKHFFECVENGKSPKIHLEDGVKVLQMVESARKSNRSGKKIVIS